MYFVQPRQRLMKGKDVRTGQIPVPNFIRHLFEWNLAPCVVLAASLGVAMSQYANKPSLHCLDVSQGGA